MNDPVLVIGLAGWGDASSAASDAVDWLVEDAEPVATFDPDTVFDFRSNRPILRASAGEPLAVTWPRLVLMHARLGGRDVLALVGNEPDYGWVGLCDELVDLAQTFGISHVVSVGAVPAPIRHAIPSPCLASASDSRLLLAGDDLMMDSIVVPASATSVFRAALEAAGYSSIGYWAQVPQYVGRPYQPAILELLRKVLGQLGDPPVSLDDIERDAMDQVARLDEILEKRSDARDFVEGLDVSVGTSVSMPTDLPTADEIADEVSQFLQSSDETDDS
jgi:hypothetical protein